MVTKAERALQRDIELYVRERMSEAVRQRSLRHLPACCEFKLVDEFMDLLVVLHDPREAPERVKEAVAP